MIATVSLPVVPYADVLNIRKPRYHIHPDLKLRARGDAVEFINKVGIALLFPGENMPLPDLWTAINGMERKLPKRHHDAALSKTWDWKDTIPARKEAWYGKLVRGKPAFLSLKDLPAMYALSPNYGELDDYLEAYADGMMSVEAKSVYEVLLSEGPLSTNALRKACNLSGGGDNARRFERAIVELQTGLKIVKSGISNDNRWKYCYIYDLLLRWSPTLGEEARQYTSRTAMRHLITRYLQTSVAAPMTIFPRLLGWDPGVTQRVVEEMVGEGALDEVRVVGGPGLTPRAKPFPSGDVWLRLGM